MIGKMSSMKEYWRQPFFAPRDFENAVAAVKLVVIQRRRKSVGLCGRQVQPACRERMLRYLEDSGDVKVGVTELQEQLEISEEAGVSIRQIAQQGMNDNGQEKVCIASLARWNAQSKGLVELKRRCRDTMQEVIF